MSGAPFDRDAVWVESATAWRGGCDHDLVDDSGDDAFTVVYFEVRPYFLEAAPAGEVTQLNRQPVGGGLVDSGMPFVI